MNVFSKNLGSLGPKLDLSKLDSEPRPSISKNDGDSDSILSPNRSLSPIEKDSVQTLDLAPKQIEKLKHQN